MAEENLEEKLKEITRTDFKRLISKTLDQYNEHADKLKKQYLTQLETINKEKNKLYMLLRDDQIYQGDYRVKYYMNEETAEVTLYPTKRNKIGFNQEDS